MFVKHSSVSLRNKTQAIRRAAPTLRWKLPNLKTRILPRCRFMAK